MFTIWSGTYHGLDHRYHHPHLGVGFSPIQNHARFHPHQTLATTAKEDLGHVEVLTSKEKFFVKLDTRGYCPEELEIKILDGFLVIQGETRESGGEAFKTSRRFRRRFFLPVNCKEDEMHCELGGIRDDDTILKVTIPREVPDGKGKLHLISMSGVARTPCHVTYPSHHGHNFAHGHLVMNGYWVSGVECNRDRFVLRLELPRFSPDEICVKTVDDFLVVEGDQREKEEGHEGSGVLGSCSFRRRYLLPVNSDRDGLECEINDEGRLKVIVPRINLGKTEHEKIHKVERT